jgi:hypothetical protein
VRLYVLVTSVAPLRIFRFDDGLVRLATVKSVCRSTSAAPRLTHPVRPETPQSKILQFTASGKYQLLTFILYQRN